MKFLPHEGPGIAALCPLAWVPPGRGSDCPLHQALLQCTISLLWDISVWVVGPVRNKTHCRGVSEGKPLVRANLRSKFLLMKDQFVMRDIRF